MGERGGLVTSRFRCRAIIIVALAIIVGVIPARAAPPEAFPVATEIRIGGDDNQTRLVIDLTRKVDLRVFTLADPYRVVIDMPQVTFALPAKAGDSGRGLIKAYRYGLVMAGGSRIVIDVSKPVRVDKVTALDATSGVPARLVLDLAAVDRATFMRTLAIDSKARTDTVKPTRDTPVASNDPRPMIVIDPGHGGPDTGAKAPGGEHEEKAIVLEFGTLLRDQLEKSGKYRVVMTRTDDTFIPLDERVRFARNRGAQLFISIHADWLPRAEGDAQGASIYTLSETASDPTAARLAEAENRADAVGGVDLSREPSDVADILFDLAQRETRTYSHQFAKTLVGEMKSGAVRMHQHPMKSAGFKVLKSPDVPSVLVELGYVSNKEDLKALLSPEWRNKTVGTIGKAVDAFFAPRVAGNGEGKPRR
jgi:N-acetylmuramoyl-L-alanine amidase